MHSATTYVVLLVGMVEWLLFNFSEATQVSQGLLQSQCWPRIIKGGQGGKVCCFEVLLFTLFLGYLVRLSTMSSVMVHKDKVVMNLQVL
jgi:hypothetical protein